MSYADVAKAYRQAENEKVRMNPSARYMTLRDYFAAKAMQGIIASLQEGEDFTDRGCEWAYKVADAMLKARN